MATKYASAAGNWSTLQWKDARSGGNNVTKPGVGDTADANAVDVTLDEDFTCDQIQTIVAVGGRFLLPAGAVTRTVTCNYVSTYASINYCTYVASGQTLILNGNFSSSGGFYLQTYAGTIIINGNITGNAVNSQWPAFLNSGAAAVTTVNGNIINASNGLGWAFQNNNGTLNLNGLPLTTGTEPAVTVQAGTVNWTGTRVIAADQMGYILQHGGTVNLASLNLSVAGKHLHNMRAGGTLTLGSGATAARIYERKGGQVCGLNCTLPKIIAMPYPLGA